MLTTIATASWPLYFVLALGFVAGKRGSFPRDAAAELNELTMPCALPEAAIAGLCAASPAGPFFGPAVLSPQFGQQGGPASPTGHPARPASG